MFYTHPFSKKYLILISLSQSYPTWISSTTAFTGLEPGWFPSPAPHKTLVDQAVPGPVGRARNFQVAVALDAFHGSFDTLKLPQNCRDFKWLPSFFRGLWFIILAHRIRVWYMNIPPMLAYIPYTDPMGYLSGSRFDQENPKPTNLLDMSLNPVRWLLRCFLLALTHMFWDVKSSHFPLFVTMLLGSPQEKTLKPKLIGGIPTALKNISQLGLLFPIYGKK